MTEAHKPAPDGAVEASRREIWMPKRADVTIQGMLAALGDPIRLEVVRQMAERGELRPTDFLGIGSKQNLTHHLRVLRDAGLLNARYEGRNKAMWLRRELIDDIAPGLLDGVLRALSAHSRERGRKTPTKVKSQLGSP